MVPEQESGSVGFGSVGSGSSGLTSSALSGEARDVVQARDVRGGIHFHAVGEPEPRPPRQLPADVHGFVGRAAELGHLDKLLDAGASGGARLVVIAGTAGAGKSALAVRFAHRIHDRFPDGQLFVNLRGYDSGPPIAPQAALERFLRALGVMPHAMPQELEERAELYRSLLAGRRLLVVADNVATVGQVRPLLPGDAGCVVLVTSRSRLSGLSAREGAYRLTVGLLPHREATVVRATAAGAPDRGRTRGVPPDDAAARPDRGPPRRVVAVGRAVDRGRDGGRRGARGVRLVLPGSAAAGRSRVPAAGPASEPGVRGRGGRGGHRRAA